MQKIILSTNSAKHFGLDNGALHIGKFPDGEVSVVLNEEVKDKEIFVIGSTESPAENLIELTLLISKVYADGAGKVTAIIPYFGYSRGDREAKQGEVASAEAVSKMIQSVSGENFEMVFFDLHSKRIPVFFTCPVREISMATELSMKFSKEANLSIVAPDGGAVERAEKFAESLGISGIVKVEKKRKSEREVEIIGVQGDIGEKAVIVDDMIQTGGTVLEVAKMLKEKGVKEISVVATHMIYSAGGWKRLAQESLIKKVVITNSIRPPGALPEKFEIINIAAALNEVING